MAGSRVQFQESDGDEGETEFDEDEYGYLKPKDKMSQVLIAQLPSKHLDSILFEDLKDGSSSTSTLRRRDSQYRTLQLKNATLNSRHRNKDADKIYEILNADKTLTEEEKMKTLRETHQSLTIKRQVKERLDADRKEKIATRTLGCFLRYQLSMSMALHKFSYQFKNTCYYFEPWHTSIKTIQGEFGSCVASYFIFLRWLLYLNVLNFLITFSFVFIPEHIYRSYEHRDALSYLGNRTEAFHMEHLLTGSGWLLDSLLYLGAYSSEKPDSGRASYSIPLAYLITTILILLTNLAALSYSFTSSYQKNYVDTAGEIKNVFCNKIFSAWDYSIETENAALLQKHAFCNDIKELLYSKRLSERRMTLSQSILQKISFLIVSAFSIAVVVGVGFLTHYLLKNKSIKMRSIPIVEHMLFAISVTVISSVFYYLLKFLTFCEAYISQKSRLYFTMIRVVVLRTVMLGVVAYFWMFVYKPQEHKDMDCFEAELGSEFYRLIMTNFFMSVVVFTLLGEFVRKLIHNRFPDRISRKEFDVAYETLDLVYFQTLAWLSIYCMPLVSLIVVIILVILFYLKKASMSSSCRPPKRSWSINETQTFYLVLAFVMLFFASFVTGYIIFQLETSSCGPFKEFNVPHEVFNTLYKNKSLKEKISPAVLFVIFCVLCLVTHFMRARAKAHKLVIKRIRETLILASKDKVFLLRLFDDAFNAHVQSKSIGSSHPKNEPSSAGLHGDDSSSISSGVRRTSHPNTPSSQQGTRKNGLKSPNCKGSPFPPHQAGFRNILLPT